MNNVNITIFDKSTTIFGNSAERVFYKDVIDKLRPYMNEPIYIYDPNTKRHIFFEDEDLTIDMLTVSFHVYPDTAKKGKAFAPRKAEEGNPAGNNGLRY